MRPENRERLGPHDAVLAAHPGSGASWIGTLLVRLGIFHVSGHDEVLLDRTSQRTGGWIEEDDAAAAQVLARPGRRLADLRLHLPDLHERPRAYREPCRVVQTNASAIAWKPPCRVLLLVRDGRDALLSLYHHLRGFSGLDVPFGEFLTGGAGAWPAPARSWAVACTSWVAATPQERLHVLRFEAARERPVEELRAMLRFLGVERGDAELEHAIERSSYAAMRRAEKAALAEHGAADRAGRFMRRGQVGEWRGVYTAEMLATFTGTPRRALEHFGYPTDGIPAR